MYKAECSSRCGRRCGLFEPLSVTLDYTQESIHETRAGPPAILISPSFSPWGGEEKGGGEQDGDISTTLQCITTDGWYRISSKLTEISLPHNTDGQNTSKMVPVGSLSISHQSRFILYIYTSQYRTRSCPVAYFIVKPIYIFLFK